MDRSIGRYRFSQRRYRRFGNFGVLGCYLVAFIGNSSLGPALVLCLAKPITTSINNPFAFNNREQPHQHQKPTRWILEEEEE